MLNTAASVISYVDGIEQESAAFYTTVSPGEGENAEHIGRLFDGFAKENERFSRDVKRAYYSVVSDALETGFCFQNLETNVDIPDTHTQYPLPELLGSCLRMEEDMLLFYTGAASAARAFLRDVSRSMDRVARSREKRLSIIRSLINDAGTGSGYA